MVWLLGVAVLLAVVAFALGRAWDARLDRRTARGMRDHGDR